MNLVYLLIKENDDVVFEYQNKNYEISVNKEKNIVNFLISKKNNYTLYNSLNVLDSYLVLGKNATGKTTLLNDIYSYSLKMFNINETSKKILYIFEDDKFYLYRNYLDFNEFLNNVEFKINNQKPEIPKKVVTGFICKQNDYNQYCFKLNNQINKRKNKLNLFSNKNMLNFLYKELKSKNKLLKWADTKKIYIKVNMPVLDRRFNRMLQTNNVKIIIIISLIGFISTDIRIRYRDFYSRFLDVSESFMNEIINNNNISTNYFEDILTLLNNFKNEIEHDLFTGLANNIKKFKDIFVKLNKYVEYFEVLKPTESKLIFYFEYNDLKDKNIYEFLKWLVGITYDSVKYSFNGLKEICELKIFASTGEQSLLELIACTRTCIEELNKQYKEPLFVHMLFDEIEQNLHPEWCRLLYSKIVEVINKTKTHHKFYIYMSTHSPYVVSDFTSDHIINLDDFNSNSEFETFGANIHDILSKGMFLDNPMGDFALSKIRDVHNALITAQSKENAITNSKFHNEDKLLYFIDNIGEPLIKTQLKSLWLNLEYKENNRIDEFVKSLNKDELNELYTKVGEKLNAKD